MARVARKLQIVDDSEDDLVIRVAFASSDHKMVDQHFGTASRFAIYGVNPERSALMNVIEFTDIEPEHDEGKLAIKIENLDGCIAVYSRACGASAVKQLINIGIQPVKVHEGAEISELIEALQQELLAGPSTWLAKALQKNTLNESRFDDMEMEGWDE